MHGLHCIPCIACYTLHVVNRLRELRGSTRRHELAIEVGVDPTTIYRWETGRSPIPDDMKRVLADKLGVTVSELMGWEKEPAA